MGEILKALQIAESETRGVQMRALTLGLAVLLGALLGGCTIETYRIASPEEVELAAADTLEKKVGERPDAIECQDELKLKAGESIRCILIDGGTRIGMTVSVEASEGEKLNYDFKVDEEPLP